MSTRDTVVAEALEWVGTTYHHEARIKGVGVDCAQILIGVYSAVGLVEAFDTGHYPPDWHLHRSDEIFLGWMRQYADEMPDDYEPLPGDLVLYKFGRCFSHGAIVIAWPLVVHADRKQQCVAIDHGDQGDMAPPRARVMFKLRNV